MTGKIVVDIVVCIGAIVSAIMHGDKSKKADIAVLAVMLQVMAEQLRQSEQLPHFGITRQVNTHQEYDQKLSQLHSNIQK